MYGEKMFGKINNEALLYGELMFSLLALKIQNKKNYRIAGSYGLERNLKVS